MNEFVLNGLVKRRASVTRAPKPRKINEQKTAFASALKRARRHSKIDYFRSDLKPARSSSVKSFGCSQAAK